MKKNLVILFVCLSTLSSSFAQNNYAATDQYVTKLGSMDSLNLAQIAKNITAASGDKEQQSRAIFFWIANNIALDPKAIKGNDQRKSLPEDVVKLRKGTALGFAKLFQEMASIANIRCLVVDGYTRNSIDDLNSPADEINHSWNVVQLGQSPDTWQVLDAAKASGTSDKKMSLFTKKFESGYFFTDKTLFNLDHFADNDAWQLGSGPKSLKEFYALPVIESAAYEYGLRKPTPATGFIKTKTKSKVSFSIPVISGASIENVSILIGEGRRMQKPEPMNFSGSGGAITFSYQFKVEDTYPVKILVDEKVILEYMVEVNE
jgi:transglutaminase/protease-like cytokinesis protein 3